MVTQISRDLEVEEEQSELQPFFDEYVFKYNDFKGVLPFEFKLKVRKS